MTADRREASRIETHDTPFGRRFVAAAFGDEVWVSAVPLNRLPYTLTERPNLRPHSQTVRFTVLRADDGTRDTVLRDNIRRRPPTMDAAFDHARTLAADYANAHATYMDELRETQRAGRIVDLERLVADTPTKSERWSTTNLKETAERKLSQLPVHLRELIRDTEPTYAAMREAPAPLGPVLNRSAPADHMERLVSEVCNHLVWIRVIERDYEQRRGKLLAEIAALREEADQDVAPSAPRPF